MKLSDLSLRERRLLNYLVLHKGFVTGTELASYLEVSARTIRNEVASINQLLEADHIQIDSKHSHGYFLTDETRAKLKQMEKGKQSFLTREERVRHIAYRLTLAEEPLDLGELQDEMFISQTTLEHDLTAMRKTYLESYPYIKMIRHKNSIQFEEDERKRRSIYNRLLADNWNYNARGNTFYEYQYLDETVIHEIMDVTRECLKEAGLRLEDVNMVVLNLGIAIAEARIADGHGLTGESPWHCEDPVAISVTDAMLDRLETALNCEFPPVEREEIYRHVSCSLLFNAKELNFNTVFHFFDPQLIHLADEYLQKILQVYHLNFVQDEDFYITILQYLRYLALPLTHLNEPEMPVTHIRNAMRIEFEIAFLFQPFAKQYLGRYLEEKELLYLAFCIGGALKYYYRVAPKLETIIMCHLSLPAGWQIKQLVLNQYGDYIHVQEILPLYMKDSFDFSQTDLILSTVKKTIQTELDPITLHISPEFSADDSVNLESFIHESLIRRLILSNVPSVSSLLEEADWYEALDGLEYEEVLQFLAQQEIQAGNVADEYLKEILGREQLLTFASNPSLILVHSLAPATKTHLSIATLKHRVRKNNYKIRTFVLLTVRPEEAGALFQMILWLFGDHFNLQDARFKVTREEWMEYFKPYLPE